MDNLVKDIHCYEFFGGIALKNYVFFSFVILHIYCYIFKYDGNLNCML